MQCETVRIVAEKSDDNESGFIVINKSDFDADKHELFDAEPGEPEAPALTAKQMKEALTTLGVEFKPNANKAELQALLDAAE